MKFTEEELQLQFEKYYHQFNLECIIFQGIVKYRDEDIDNVWQGFRTCAIVNNLVIIEEK